MKTIKNNSGERNNKEKTKDKYDPDYTYKNQHIEIDKKSNIYPVIEATNNGLLYPEKIKDNMDVEEFK